MNTQKTISINKQEKALLELVRSAKFQKVTVSIEAGKIVHFKREENIKPDTYQAKSEKNLA